MSFQTQAIGTEGHFSLALPTVSAKTSESTSLPDIAIEPYSPVIKKTAAILRNTWLKCCRLFSLNISDGSKLINGLHNVYFWFIPCSAPMPGSTISISVRIDFQRIRMVGSMPEIILLCDGFVIGVYRQARFCEANITGNQ